MTCCMCEGKALYRAGERGFCKAHRAEAVRAQKIEDRAKREQSKIYGIQNEHTAWHLGSHGGGSTPPHVLHRHVLPVWRKPKRCYDSPQAIAPNLRTGEVADSSPKPNRLSNQESTENGHAR